MANYSRWDDLKKTRPGPSVAERLEIEHDFALGELIYNLRTEAGLSQGALAERMGTTPSVVSRLEEGGETRSR
jgi:ribosome-binding protein aMBF1 (putative translation factor)